jgi:RNA-directed DNA polymerase
LESDGIGQLLSAAGTSRRDPKGDGKTRPLGIPTVADRIAQMVVTRFLSPILEPQFHVDSYGYRPKKSAKDALAAARQRCWRYDWVLDLDIKSFFETLEHKLLMRAVRRHTMCPWVLLYIQRWLQAPTKLADNSLIERTSGTPQGGVVSPILANLYLHYAFDLWMGRDFPNIPFERYADDVICHCDSEAQATQLKNAIQQRFATCSLTLHPQKTKIAYCKDDRRQSFYTTVQFNFLGYTFRPRRTKGRSGKALSASTQVSVRSLPPPFDSQCGIGKFTFAAICHLKTSRNWLIRAFVAGLTTTEHIIGRS